jgi:hypothetical protein
LSQEDAGFRFHEVTDDPQSVGFGGVAVPFTLTRRPFTNYLDAIAGGP